MKGTTMKKIVLGLIGLVATAHAGTPWQNAVNDPGVQQGWDGMLHWGEWGHTPNTVDVPNTTPHYPENCTVAQPNALAMASFYKAAKRVSVRANVRVTAVLNDGTHFVAETRETQFSEGVKVPMPYDKPHALTEIESFSNAEAIIDGKVHLGVIESSKPNGSGVNEFRFVFVLE
jgi:hypothetical protein